MNKIKSLEDISWKVTEEEYRADKALSYSTLAKYSRSGFNGLSSLFDKIETPSLTFGSAVDSIITGGFEEFNDRFLVIDYETPSDTIIKMCQCLYESNKELRSLEEGTNDELSIIIDRFNYQPNWKPETRIKVFKEKGTEYFNLLHLKEGKTLLDRDTYNDVIKTVESLQNSRSTEWYFKPNNPFENVERLYQLKFKGTFNGVNYRCMADLIIVDYETKTIIPVDLKTSSKHEWDFFKSFMDWSYHIQARLYWNIIRQNLDNDPYFKDFNLLDYRFIVVNRHSLSPLVWDFHGTQSKNTLYYGNNNEYICRDPFEIGKELNEYLSMNHEVPLNIHKDSINNIDYWLNNYGCN